MQKFSIKELRHLLLHEPQFATIHTYFMDWLEEHHATAFDTRVKNKTLMTAMKIGLSKYYNTEIAFKHLRMQEVKGIHLIHGAGEAMGKKNIRLVFFYFTDLDMGLISSLEDNSDEEGLIRFQMLRQSNFDIDLTGQMN